MASHIGSELFCPCVLQEECYSCQESVNHPNLHLRTSFCSDHGTHAKVGDGGAVFKVNFFTSYWNVRSLLAVSCDFLAAIPLLVPEDVSGEQESFKVRSSILEFAGLYPFIFTSFFYLELECIDVCPVENRLSLNSFHS